MVIYMITSYNIIMKSFDNLLVLKGAGKYIELSSLLERGGAQLLNETIRAYFNRSDLSWEDFSSSWELKRRFILCAIRSYCTYNGQGYACRFQAWHAWRCEFTLEIIQSELKTTPWFFRELFLEYSESCRLRKTTRRALYHALLKGKVLFRPDAVWAM